MPAPPHSRSSPQPARNVGRNTNLVLIGAGAVVAYYLYTKATAAAKAAGVAYTGSVNTVSDFLTTLFGPATTAANAVFYTVIFEDGTRNAVPASTVDSNGNFTWTGYPAGSQPAQALQILVGTDGTKYAISNG